MGAGNLEAVGVVNPVLAHMGGIDEIGIFLIPALLAIYALRRSERQARKRAEAEAANSSEEGAVDERGSPVIVDEARGPEALPPPA
jgi:hypothetical protein